MPETEDKNPRIRTLIAEDHQLTRNGLVYSLEKAGGFSVVAESENGRKAVAASLELTPDLVLMDISMPVMDGITATQEIKATQPDVKVVILTSHQEPEHVMASLSAGADAYCLKDTPIDRLIEIIKIVYEGGVWLDPAIAGLVLGMLPDGSAGPMSIGPAPGGKTRKRYNTQLTDRELDILRHIVDGKGNQEIANALDISLHTVKTHVCNIIQKLAVDDRTQAAVKALKEGLV